MYWSPSLIAYGRRARHWPFIALFNSLLGWTVVGWLAAIAWSLMAKAQGQEASLDETPAAAGAALRARAWLILAPLARLSGNRLARG